MKTIYGLFLSLARNLYIDKKHLAFTIWWSIVLNIYSWFRLLLRGHYCHTKSWNGTATTQINEVLLLITQNTQLIP